MKIPYTFNKWEYEIIKNEGEGLKGYGYSIKIYKNDLNVYNVRGFGSESMALIDIKKYIIVNEHNIDLSDYND
mgnify:CR=1 FL=1